MFPGVTGLPAQIIGLESCGYPAEIVTVTPPTNPVTIGQPLDLEITVSSSQSNPVPTGSIFLASQTTILTQQVLPLTNGTATFQGVLPNAGPIELQYSGDGVFAPGSAFVELNASTATPMVSVSANLQAATPSEQISVTAAVTPPPEAIFPTGTVQFFDSFDGAAPVAFGVPQLLATVPDANGIALIAIPASLQLGTHVFTASYSGDVNYNPVSAAASTSATVSVVASLPSNPVSANFGSVPVGAASGAQSVNVRFSANGTLSAITVRTQGEVHSNFEFVDPGTCITGTPFSAGQSCMVDVTFAPDFSGTALGAVILTDGSNNILGTQYIVGLGMAPQIAFDFGAPFPITSSSNGGIDDAEFLAADGRGNVFIADNGNQRVIKQAPGCQTSNCQTVVASSGNGLSGAEGVAVDGAGNLYVADPVGNLVMMIPPGCAATACTKVIASQSRGEISTPRKLAIDGAGDLFIADLNNSRVVEVPVGCKSSACQEALGTGLSTVYGVAVDATGNVFISDFGNGQVVKLPPGCAGGACQSTVVSGLVEPKGITLDGAGNLYIAENAQVVEISAANGTQGILASGAALGPSGNPTDVAIGPGGSLFIADPGDVQVSKLDRGDPPQVTFSATRVGLASPPQDVTVENIGTEGLNLLSLAATTNAALDPTTTCTNNSLLPAGASCTLGVDFAPTSAGNGVAGSVVVSDNTRNQDNATQTMLVMGTGSEGASQMINFPALPNPVTLGVAPITLQATATSGLSVSYTGSGPASISGSILTILGAGSVTVTANQSGNANYAAAPPVSQTITVNAQPTGDFTIASSPQSLTLHTGQSGTVTITVTPSGGFNSLLNFSCSQQALVTCSFHPPALTPDGASATTTLTVTASGTLVASQASDTPGRALFALALSIAFASFAISIVLINLPGERRRNKFVGAVFAALVGMAFTAGCGSGGNQQPQTGVVTVSASTGGNASHSLSLTITVTP